MPRNIDPGTLKRNVSATTTTVVADAGADNVAHVDSSISGLHVKVTSAQVADGSESVQEVLSNFKTTLHSEPPKLGEVVQSFSQQYGLPVQYGIPDWGVLKLEDSSLGSRSLIPTTNDGSTVYPYYYDAPSPAVAGVDGLVDPAFPIDGRDLKSDYMFNSGVSGLAGAGEGMCHTGAYTPSGSAPQEIKRTARILPRSTVVDGTTGKPRRTPVVVSGVIYPADKGVFALMHFNSDNTFDKCVAAVLLGQGILPSARATTCQNGICDGDVGSLFAEGSVGTFPSRVAGQYDLKEIHLGVDALNGDPLRAPFDDLNGDSVTGAACVSGSGVPAAGQVRYGLSDLATPYGIPVLGGGPYAYSPPISTSVEGGYIVHGDTVLVTPTSQEPNFLSYRLPVSKSYASLPATPRGLKTETKEAFRFFQYENYASATYPNGSTVGDLLPTAGFYTDFEEDHPEWQLCRYRHMFLMPSDAATGDRELVGTYWLIHFKKESDFESFLGGTMPGSSTYSVYGSSLVSSTLDDTANVANEVLTTENAPFAGPAPDYGYASTSYHAIRSRIVQDPAGIALPTMTGSWDYTVPVPTVMYVSGVAYFTALNTNGDSNLSITDLTFGSSGPHTFFDETYRTDSLQAAKISSPNPALLSIAAIAYGESALTPTYPSLVAGALTELHGPRIRRLEFPYTVLGTTGSGAFSESNAPLPSSPLLVELVDPIELLGDATTPSFSQDVQLRAFFRRPNGHVDETSAILPSAGIKLALSSTLLLHTTSFNTTGMIGEFGNFLSSGPVDTYSQHFTAEKDYWEKFLDESYRYFDIAHVSRYTTAFGPTDSSYLTMTGMAGSPGDPIETPVQIGRESGSGLADVSWVLSGVHLLPLDSGLAVYSLQVAGIPDRNPPITDGAAVPFPSSGMLCYPQKDYSTGYRPEEVADGLTGPQPDYSTFTGVLNYIRCFDAAMSRSELPRNVNGQQHLTLRFDGITLAAFRHDAATSPGIGRVSTGGMGISIRIPGLTTWMDLGRQDGTGPSKQDPVLDGAGCAEYGADTFDGVDETTKMVYCQVLVNVGPVASLFVSSNGESPVLVRVQMGEDARDYALEKPYTEDSDTFGSVDTDASASLVRGLTGIRIV